MSFGRGFFFFILTFTKKSKSKLISDGGMSAAISVRARKLLRQLIEYEVYLISLHVGRVCPALNLILKQIPDHIWTVTKTRLWDQITFDNKRVTSET